MPSLLLYFLLLLPIPSLTLDLFDDPFSSWVHKFIDNIFTDTVDYSDSIFNETLAFINKFNAENDDFILGDNLFSSMTTEEFVSKYCGTAVPKRPDVMTVVETAAPEPLNQYTLDDLPRSISWKRYASPVRSQGPECGACWAFSTMQLIEIHNRIRNDDWNKILAPQYLVDCDKSSNNCKGGWPTDALIFLATTSKNRAPKESDYPYTGEEFVDDRCLNKYRKVYLNIEGIYEQDLNGDEDMLKLLVANHGPVVITMNVSEQSKYFKQYKSGIFYDPECRKTDANCTKINHSMLVVGYGVTKKGKGYFEVQNTWGPEWGDDGYIKMSMGRGNNCNIACFAIYMA